MTPHAALFCDDCTVKIGLLARFWGLAEALYHLRLYPLHTVRVIR